MILYKYYPCNEYTFRALSEMGLWCSPVSNMNDPFDCLGQLELDLMESYNDDNFKTKYPELHQNLTLNNNTRKSFFDFVSNTRRFIIENLSFCSLSENPFNIMMWSHYANSHQGIVIEIELDSDILLDTILCEVTYSNSLLKFDLNNFLSMFNKNINVISYYNFYKYLSIKTEDWIKEDEYRLWNGKNKSNNYIYYKPENLKSVYFGYKCPEEIKTLVKSILRGHGVSDDIYHDIKVKTIPKIELYV